MPSHGAGSPIKLFVFMNMLFVLWWIKFSIFSGQGSILQQLELQYETKYKAKNPTASKRKRLSPTRSTLAVNWMPGASGLMHSTDAITDHADWNKRTLLEQVALHVLKPSPCSHLCRLEDESFSTPVLKFRVFDAGKKTSFVQFLVVVFFTFRLT